MRGYYLTASHFALSNIALRRIKIARYSDMNDPFELASYNERDPRHRTAFQRSRLRINGEYGCICFSRNWSNPVLWAHYADKHRGIALGVDIDDDMVQPIDYVDKPLTLHIVGDGLKPELDYLTVNRWLRTKFSDWRYEDEIRASVRLDHGEVEHGCYFTTFSEDLDLKEVIVGARCETPIAEIRKLVSDLYPSVVTIKAGIASDSFSVVANPPSVP
jgi:hypothetical protein